MKIEHDVLGKLIKASYDRKKPLFITGGTGIGKSDVVRETAMNIAKEKGLEFSENPADINNETKFCLIDIRISQLDPSDLRGLPTFDDETKTTKWFSPNWLPKKGFGLMFFDEFNLAPPSIQAAGYQLVLDRRLGDYQVPDGYTIVSAGNRLEDRANVFDLPAPLANRFCHCELAVPSIENWSNWALSKGIDNRVIAYLNYQRTQLYKFDSKNDDKAFPTPRCIKQDSLITMSNGQTKQIKDIQIGDSVLGFKNGKFVKSIVLNKFEKEIETQYAVKSTENSLVCSGEHKFLTDEGYVQAKDLNKDTPVYVYGEISVLDRTRNNLIKRSEKHKTQGIGKTTRENRQGNIAENNVVRATTVENSIRNSLNYEKDGIGLSCRFNRWGRKYLLLPQEKRNQMLERTATSDTQLFRFIQGLCFAFKFQGNGRKTKSGLAKQIYNKGLWLWNSETSKAIDSILNTKKTASTIVNTICKNKNETTEGVKIQRNGRTETIKGNNKTVKFKATTETVSIRKRNNSEIFYDLTTTTENYIANGFITHNSWSFASDLIKDIKDISDMELFTSTAVGDATAIQFASFIKLQAKLDLQEFLRNPDKCEMPEQIDLKYALVLGLADYYKENKGVLPKVLKLIERLEPEFGHLLLRCCKNNNARFMQQLLDDDCKPTWLKVSKTYQKYL